MNRLRMTLFYVAIGTCFLVLAVWFAWIAFTTPNSFRLGVGLAGLSTLVGSYIILNELFTRSQLRVQEIEEKK